jgi:transposase
MAIAPLPRGDGRDLRVALRELMQRHDLTQRQIAEVCAVSVKTVESWLADPGSANSRRMPPRQWNALHALLPPYLKTLKKKRP